MVLLRSIPVFLLAAAGSLLAQPAAPDADIRGPKPPVGIPVPEKPDYALWLALGGLAAAAALGWFIWRRMAARRRAEPPHEAALARLSELERRGGSLPADAFAYQAADCVRQFIAGRFGLAAPRRTTEEFLRDLASASHTPLKAEGDSLKTFLKSCDLAKFAGAGLDDAQRGDLLRNARDFVRATARPAEKP